MEPSNHSHLTTGANQNRKSFLIRFWRENGEEQWRVTLESASTGKKHHFKDVKSFADAIPQLLENKKSN